MHPHSTPVAVMAVKLNFETKNRLQKLGILKQRSPHWLMKEAIANYLAQEEAAENLKQETLSRWQEVENGKLVENKAVMKWLDSWGTEHENRRPPCKN